MAWPQEIGGISSQDQQFSCGSHGCWQAADRQLAASDQHKKIKKKSNCKEKGGNFVWRIFCRLLISSPDFAFAQALKKWR
jgi:hypothetical protein